MSERTEERARPLADISIIGGGIDTGRHLTREAADIIRRARVIFHSRYGLFLSRWIAAHNRRAETHDLDSIYRVGAFRPQLYDLMARRVVAAALDGAGVVLVEPGSPMVVDRVTDRVIARAQGEGLLIDVCPAVSCVEATLALLTVDLAEGLQVIQAQELVAGAHRLNPHWHTVIIQPAYYDTRWYVGWPESRPTRYDALQNALNMSLPASAAMAAVRLPLEGSADAEVFWCRIKEFPDVAPLLTPLHTLFIPRVESVVPHRAFTDRVDSWEETMKYLATDGQGRLREVNWRERDRIARRVPAALHRTSERLGRAWNRRRTRGEATNRRRGA